MKALEWKTEELRRGLASVSMRRTIKDAIGIYGTRLGRGEMNSLVKEMTGALVVRLKAKRS